MRFPLILVALSPLFFACDDDTAASPVVPDASVPLETPDSGAPAPACPTPTGAGTTHASVTASETWTAAGSPHVLTTGITIAAGITLTIESCAIVKVPARAGFLVEGKLVATGTAAGPVRFERGGDANWGSIETRRGAELRLAHTVLEGGGNANGGRLTQFATVDLRGDQDLDAQPIFTADNVTIKDSASLGVWAREGGGFAPESNALTITGGATFPLLAWTRAAGTIPRGTYTGNAVDELMIEALHTRDAVRKDMTLRDLGVPYRVGGETGGSSFTLRGDPAPLLTIEPGVTLRFAKATRLSVSDSTSGPATGALRAEGTADKPITFTSAEATPAAGDWAGILFGGAPDARNRIAHAVVAYAGGATGVSSYGCPSPPNGSFSNEGAIVIYGGQPASVFVTNTKIENSGGDGIVRGWTGDALDFAATNTFSAVKNCRLTAPKPTAGACPTVCP